jgi:ElaA protein
LNSSANLIASALDWTCKAFDALTVAELYALLQLRSEVFVVEQSCIFLDLDGSDAQALHLLGMRAGQLVASARCFGPGVKYQEASIGRVVTHASIRGSAAASGHGHALMRQAIRALEAKWGEQSIRIGAQKHLENFYAAHGFVKTGEPYLEDGILHVEMLRPSVKQ